ncbi:hypothetical protein [Cellulomonas fimi]|uniref:Molybdopterin oxidoreductase, iron sulfur subunit n=1 Tax=Cellulomonas fimi (strain ATCC 484 / DSM 20113 / JCM 1341 / CCUG 24087 / LMG 16345 / NBRC 15513 / NCIMB 8980 / NCTC 7547 / NRS-133) TaxID=590998 RepID=F4H7Z5_CELFA|nr:hypothetical protein [Cellulomonas fimi]AEE46956.1 molybdopterin oxidoreductase, iron sulfur subunit [Cellulomonas fimi ATCC 484]NNH08207.1 molybdopterin oxidoreductase [Cellulomonas fimi]VEH34683.1 Uncharacterised protein [Cellulomonas fimi]
MSDRQPRVGRQHHHVEWWVVSAWLSLAVLLVVGLVGAVGI